MAIYGLETYGDNLNHPGYDEGLSQDRAININDPIFTEIYLEQQKTNSEWMKYITSWKTITKGSTNKIRVRQKENPLIKILEFFGKDGNSPTIKIDSEDYLSKFGKKRNLTIPRNMLGNVVLPEGSSGNRVPMGNRGRVWKENGVLPVGMWDTYTEEEMLFQTFTEIQEQIMMFGDTLGRFTDAHYRDTLYYTAGFRKDFTRLKEGFNTLMSPILDDLVRTTINEMKTYGARNVNAMTASFSDYGTVPVSAKMTLKIPAEAELMIRKNPKFILPEQYSNRVASDSEIGIIGSARVEVVEGMPMRECDDGRLIADMYIIASDPLIGLKLEDSSGIQFFNQRPQDKDKNDVLNRVGAIGVKSWVGTLNVNPERTAVISLYVNNLGVDELIEYSETCDPQCPVPCTQDAKQEEEKECAQACTCDMLEQQIEDLQLKLAEEREKEADKDATDKNADKTDDEGYVVYPQALSTAAGSVSKRKEDQEEILKYQDKYGEKIISRKKFAELFPNDDVDNHVGEL